MKARNRRMRGKGLAGVLALGAAVMTLLGGCPVTPGEEDPDLSGTVRVTGTPRVGETLRVAAELNPKLESPGELEYVWQRAASLDGEYVTIEDAAEEAYNLTVEDRDMFLKVTVRRAGYSGSFTSEAVGRIVSKDQSLTPTVETATILKTMVRKSVEFTLTSEHGVGQVWQVYSEATGGEPLPETTVKVSVGGGVLTLTAAGIDLPAGVYYVSVIEMGKVESSRLALEVRQESQSAAPTSATPYATWTVTTPATTSVSFTLTSGHTGTWKVYDTATSGAVSTRVTAAFAPGTKTLTLTALAAAADFPLGAYYVTVTESGKTESNRLALTVTYGFSTPTRYRGMVYIPPSDNANKELTITGNGTGDAGAFPANRTVILGDYTIAQYETTYLLWEEVRGWAERNGYIFGSPGRGDTSTDGAFKPVSFVSWWDAVVWCNAYSEIDSRTPVYYSDEACTQALRNSSALGSDVYMKAGANGYRLPTEAEWEAAARGGVSVPPLSAAWSYAYAGSDDVDKVAWYSGTSGSAVHAVGTKAQNSVGQGLYDMSGNVGEWCFDWYGPIATGTARDPTGADTGEKRVVRGGSWRDAASACAVDARASALPATADYYVGFRVVLHAP